MVGRLRDDHLAIQIEQRRRASCPPLLRCAVAQQAEGAGLPPTPREETKRLQRNSLMNFPTRVVRRTAGSFSVSSCYTRTKSSRRLLCSGGNMDKQARKERIEKIIAMEEALHTLEEMPLPERFRKLAESAETHLSGAEHEWLYQQWQQVLERSMAD